MQSRPVTFWLFIANFLRDAALINNSSGLGPYFSQRQIVNRETEKKYGTSMISKVKEKTEFFLNLPSSTGGLII